MPLPWRRPRFELLLLALVAIVALAPVIPYDEQDNSRVCLAQALVHGRVSDDVCFADTVDSSQYKGHLYSNKAPGMSVFEIVPVEAFRVPSPVTWVHTPSLRLWALHLVVSGIPFLLCVFMVGRIAEGLVPGVGPPVIVAFGLGTILTPLAVTGFSHPLVAMLAFLAFVLAWSRRPILAGLAAGAAVTVEYQTVVVLLVVLGYSALRGREFATRYALAAVPGVLLAGAYNWAAFGAPWHDPLSYSSSYADDVSSGLLGIHLPTIASTQLVFVGERGLLLTSPVLVPAAVGLVLLWRRGIRAEASVCILIVAAYLIAECGYFIPYGGQSPGPRFIGPALPFLLVGLAPAFARWRVLTSILTAASIVATTTVVFTWSLASRYRDTIWGEVWRQLLRRPNDFSVPTASEHIFGGRISLPLVVGVLVAAAVAFAIALIAEPRRTMAT